MNTTTVAALAAALSITLIACGNKPEGGGLTTSSASSAKPKPTAIATASAVAKASAVATASAAPTASAAASASAEPSASADVEPAGPVHIHLDTVKVTSGKSDGSDKVLKTNMLKLRNACVAPAIKKTPSFEGTLLVTLDVGDSGKIDKASPKVTAGKLPTELTQCVGKFYEEKIQLGAGKATIEATILMGPKVSTKK